MVVHSCPTVIVSQVKNSHFLNSPDVTGHCQSQQHNDLHWKGFPLLASYAVAGAQGWRSLVDEKSRQCATAELLPTSVL